jgi:hypothetical protein
MTQVMTASRLRSRGNALLTAAEERTRDVEKARRSGPSRCTAHPSNRQRPTGCR